MNTVIENMGLWSILPPLLTVIVALAFKDVVLALLSGIFSGLLIVNRGDVVIAALQMVDRIASSLCDAWNIRIFLFCALLGSFVAILSRTGSAYAFGSWAANRIKSRKGTMFFTFFFGILIFAGPFLFFWFAPGDNYIWLPFGILMSVGPIVYHCKLCKAMNLLCENYNEKLKS